MYLYLGEKSVVFESDVVGIFDIEVCTTTQNTRDFLKSAQNNDMVEVVSNDLPKSFVVCFDKKKKQKVFLSQISVSTLKKRSYFLI